MPIPWEPTQPPAAPATTKTEDLPSVEWAREAFRKRLAEDSGVPAAYYESRPTSLVYGPVWEKTSEDGGVTTEYARINNELCWAIGFRVEDAGSDKRYIMKGHGTSVSYIVNW